VKTEWNRHIYSDPEKSKKRLSTVPIKRWVEPTEAVNAALFLPSNFTTYITGITLPVDGGRLAGLALP